eukprot:55413_1
MAEQPFKNQGETYGSVTPDKHPNVVIPIEQQAYMPMKDEQQATVIIVKWENYKQPIPVNHTRFIRRVFYTLSLQLLMTAAIIACCVYIESVRTWLVEHYWMYIVGIVANVCILCHLLLVVDVYPQNIIWLFIWTVTMAYTVGTICGAYATVFGAHMIMQALGITILTFLILALFSMQTKCNLYPLGLLAFMLINAMFFWGLWALIFGWYSSSAWALMFVIVFCLLIMFDVWRMMNMPIFDENAWIPASINLYLDIINLFLWMLRLLASSRK